MEFDRLSRKLEGLEKASENGYKVRNLHEIMRQPEIWYAAYANVYSNKGALTKGVSDTTLDDMSKSRISQLIEELKKGTYQPKPVRRVHIPKRNGKLRPLGIPTGDDKLVQEVVRILLERIYEPIFSEKSHGFRPNQSCHTALKQIQKTWTGIKWFVEFDISEFFNNVNHETLIELLKKRIDDKRFIQLIEKVLKAGYLENWVYHRSYSGTPQGGIISPILSNIYLHELDRFIEKLVSQFNKGKKRPKNHEYGRVESRKHRLREKINREGKFPFLIKELRELDRKQKELPSGDPYSDKYKRLKYCRYADDFVLGVIGSKQEAKEILAQVVLFLQETLSLQIAEDKTKIESAKDGIQFLSYQISTWRANKVKKVKVGGTHSTRRTVTEPIHLMVPPQKVIEFCNKYRYGDWYQNKPLHRAELLNNSDVEIISTYNAELRGLANYYYLADDVKRKLARLSYLSKSSLIKTLAAKYQTQKVAIFKRLKEGKELVHKYQVAGETKRLKVFTLKHITKAPKNWELDELPNTLRLTASKSELVKRMNAQKCEYCGRSDLPTQVHHVKKLKDLKAKPNLALWQKVMIARQRKTIILCSTTPDSCHTLLHAGKLPDSRFNSTWTNTSWKSKSI